MRLLKVFLGLIMVILLYSCTSGSSSSSSTSGANQATTPEEEIVLYCENGIPMRLYEYDSSPELGIDNNEIRYEEKYNTENPLAYYQWHIANRGQESIFGQNQDELYKISNKIDINVEQVHNEDKIRGKGINIVINDSGLEVFHEDLRVDLEKSYSYIKGTNDSTPSIGTEEDPRCTDHGTLVAGVAGAKSGNKVGGVGVAPNATLIGVELESTKEITQDTSMLGVGFGDPAGEIGLGIAQADIFNFSWGGGYDYTGETTNNLLLNSIFTKGIETGRGGKGYIYVQASGNGFDDPDTDNDECMIANKLGISCHNADFDLTLRNPYIVKVSATSIGGIITEYSSAGANVFVSAPSEGSPLTFGRTNDEDLDCFGEEDCYPGIVTTDLMGCERGYSKKTVSVGDRLSNRAARRLMEVKNQFEYKIVAEEVLGSNEDEYEITVSEPHELNQECNYVSRFGGTSAASPVVSGVYALLLEKHPNLTWRQANYIIAKTARKIDNDIGIRSFQINDKEPISYSRDLRSDVKRYVSGITEADENKNYLVLDYGWIENDAGFNFSNNYGFGLIDAKAAIDYDIRDIPPHLGVKGKLNKNEFELIGESNDLLGNDEIKMERFPDYSTMTDEEVGFIEKSVYYIDSLYNLKDNIKFNSKTETLEEAIRVNVELGGAKSNPIEKVGIKFSGYTKLASEIYIRITSPSNTKSIVLHPFNVLSNWNIFDNFTLYSNAFYQEDPNGEWAIEIYSVENGKNDAEDNSALINYNEEDESVFTEFNPEEEGIDDERLGQINDFVYEVKLIIYN